MTAKWSRWRYLEARFVTILTIRFKGALVPAWPADRSPTRTGPVEADGAVDAQNAPTAPWKTLLVFHELPQGFPHPITHDKPRKSPESYWETRIDPKIYGAGEWCSRKHRKAHERGGWRKLHFGVDEDGYVVAEALTQNTVDDADILPDLLGQIDAPLRRFTGDGAYDTRSVYQAVGEAGGSAGVEVVVPPRRPATATPKATGPWKQRNQHIERIAEIGRQAWQKETGYRQQARVEGTFLRYKRILGGSLRAKGSEAQQREAMVGCTVLNRMLALGEAQSSAVAE